MYILDVSLSFLVLIVLYAVDKGSLHAVSCIFIVICITDACVLYLTVYHIHGVDLR
jgi:hypothetical protein